VIDMNLQTVICHMMERVHDANVRIRIYKMWLGEHTTRRDLDVKVTITLDICVLVLSIPIL